jgi:AraC-like DNA-binding protein
MLSRDEQIVFDHAGSGVVHYLTDPHSCMHHIQKDHILAYVYSGELWVQDGDNELVAGPRSNVFIRKNHRIRFAIRQGRDEQIRIVFLVLSRNMLLRFYQQMDKGLLSLSTGIFRASFLNIPPGIAMESLFLSLVPYINSSLRPSEKVMELKLTEAIYALMDADKRIATTLFDFVEPWKIDILDFLNTNFMYDLSLAEIALYTGRSVATLKRDFKKISSLTPQKWITAKRLECAQQQLKEGKKVSDIYLDLGFLSLSHFSTAFKKEYGTAPTRV